MSMPMQRRIADRGLLGVPQPLGRTYGPTGPAAPRSTWQQPPPGGNTTRREVAGRAPGSAPQMGPRPLPPNPNTSNPQTGDMDRFPGMPAEMFRPQVMLAAPWQNNYGNPGGPIMRGGPLPMPQGPQYGYDDPMPSPQFGGGRPMFNPGMFGNMMGGMFGGMPPMFGGGQRPMSPPWMGGGQFGGFGGFQPQFQPMFGGGQQGGFMPQFGGGMGGFGGQMPAFGRGPVNRMY